MTKFNLDHVAALSRASMEMLKGIVPNMNPRHRTEVETDIVRLNEVKHLVLRTIYEPGLPHGDTD